MLKIPLFPKYSTVSRLIEILQGVPVVQFKNMWNTIWDLRGTPQNSVDWTDPDAWIEERLSGENKKLALQIWKRSNKTVNPRLTRGDQFLMTGYNLVEDVNGKYQLTKKGEIFINSLDNEVRRAIDKEEGLIQILLLASAIGKGKRSDFLKDWKSYLDNNSNVREDSVIKDYLRRRMVSLNDRGYLDREGNIYTISQAGLLYLDKVNSINQNDTLIQLTKLSREIEKFNEQQRNLLRKYLEKTTFIQFEQLIKDLLTEMGYEDIIVTSPTNDKGVDVTAISQQGITTVKEVIQVKRYVKGNVQRTDLDKLRGSLHRFDAFQGTIITLSNFSKGAKEAAYEKGAAPITLIDGDKLIDMLIEKNIIITKQTFQYYTVDENYFNNIDEEIE
jgi:restriction system protein